MNIFIDAEFDVPTDTLISLGMISEDGNRTFYEVLDYSQIQDPWVKENVIPILEKGPIPLAEFHEKLEKFLLQFAGVNIIANHPNDILYFNRALINGDKGKWMKIQPLTFELDDNLSGKGSTLLHNALHDAIATKNDWLKQNA